MFGWTGKILHIDLNKKKYSVKKPDIAFYQEYIGGKGIAGFYLMPSVKEKWDSSAIPLLFFTGPLVDTLSPTSGRMTVMSKSPLTETICDASVGGKFGTFLKRAGWDGIVITGKSESLCGIEILDSEIIFKDANAFKEKMVSEVLSGIDKEYSTAVIGPAGEKGVLFANICVDGSFFAGRGGLGLVMGLKNLKYISVKGSGKTPVYDKEELSKACEDIFRLASASPILKGESGISNYGTGAIYDIISDRRAMPTDNFKKTYFENSQNMNAWHYKQKYGYKNFGCMGCHIQCKKKSNNNREIPEFETMAHFSALISNENIEIVLEANHLCREMGIDTISTAVTISCYSEIIGRKLEGKEILSLIEKIGLSKDEGEELKLGSYRYAETKGKKEVSMTVKKMELPAYDPRGVYGMALAYVTSTRGGCHLRACPISHEILRKPVVTDRFSFSGKARIIKISEDLNAMIDSLTACKFLFFAATLEEYSKVFYAVTGVKISKHDLLKKGEAIYYRERIMNSMNGFSAKNDDLPERFFKIPGTGGDGISIPALDREEFLQTRTNYYKVRGLDENGLPLKSKCE